jgi:hypothetical protein
MIKGVVKTEANYRALMLDSSSSLKDFSMDRKKYHKKHIMNQVVEEKENQAANMGRVVETLLLEPEEFDNRFYMSSCIGMPTGLMLEFVEALYRETRDATDEFGKVTMTFEELTQLAYIASGFKIKYEAVLGKFLDSDAEVYYKEIRKVRTNNLTVVTANDVTTANRIVEELKVNPVTADIVNLVNSKNYTVLNQLQIHNYEVSGHKFKSMLDKVIVDHKSKIIYPYDLKCVWSVEGFYEDYYLYRRAYIQAYLYWHAVVSLVLDPEGDYYDYKVEFPQFIICDSINYYNPLIYTLTKEDMNDAKNGFSHKGRDYPGVEFLIDELKWAQENDVWNISKTNYVNNGIVNIKGK